MTPGLLAAHKEVLQRTLWQHTLLRHDSLQNAGLALCSRLYSWLK